MLQRTLCSSFLVVQLQEPRLAGVVLPVELLGELGGGVCHVATVFALVDEDDVLVDAGAAAPIAERNRYPISPAPTA